MGTSSLDVSPEQVQAACQRDGGPAARSGPCRPLHSVDHTRGVRATRRGLLARPFAVPRVFSVLVVAISGVLARSAPAQQAAQADLSPPSPDTAMRVYRGVETWVRAGEAPVAREGDEKIPAASVVLRLDGTIIGRGVSTDEHGAAPAQATREAIGEALKRMNLTNDALAADRRREAFARVTISLELAGAFVPFSPLTYDECTQMVNWGIEGVAARFGDTLAAAFPGAMLVANDPPGQALAAAISRASGDPTLAIPSAPGGQPGTIARQNSATFYRFRTTHLAQVTPGGPPTFLFRGGRVVGPREITEASLIAFAQELALHLRRLAPGPADADQTADQGTYWAFTGRVEPPRCSALELGLAALALCEISQTLQGDMRTIDAAMEAHAAALRILQRMNLDGTLEIKDGSAAATRIALAAVLSTVYSDEIDLKPLAERTAAGLAKSYDDESGFACPETDRGLVVYEMVLHSQAGTPERERGVRALRRLYRETRPGMLVMHMPWIGRAELIATGAGETPAAAAALRDCRELVWKHQLTPDDTRDDGPDLTGGIVFTATRASLPTWQSARPLCFLATMVRVPQLTSPDERLGELSRLLAGVRFLRQLQVDETAAYASPSPARARGGVRVSLWDQREPPEASAMTLMSVSETIRSLFALKREMAQPAPAQK